MVDYNELRRKFKSKKPVAERKSKRAVIQAIAKEYEIKKAALTGGAPVMRKGMGFYLMVILLMMGVGALVFSAINKNGGLESQDRKLLKANKSIAALAEALGRYKFHTGEYPSTEDGLEPLALKDWPVKGWVGPYVNQIAKDPWGNPYHYATRPEGGHPILYSAGPNGHIGDDDDVLPEQAAFDKPFHDTTWTNHWAPYRLRDIVVAPDEATKRQIEAEMRQYDWK